jgi:NAD(P)-dependent dehydrogenase (short-subunit alcohol dehydrogenase family)
MGRSPGSGGVLVTGASSGIGAAVAGELVRRGFAVFGTIRRTGDAPELAELGATPVLMDVTDRPSIAAARALVERVLAGRPLRGVVNNAGIAGAGPLELVPLEDVRRVLDVNVLGVLAVIQVFLPLLKVSRGRIVNVSSVAGRAALPFMGPYAASKFALEGMSDSLRRELLPFGVDVIVIEPGSVRSKIWDKVQAMDLSRYRGTSYERALERFRERALRAVPRLPSADIVARAVARALTARRPRVRVVVSDHPWLERLVLLLPDRVLDRLVGWAVWRSVGVPDEGTRARGPDPGDPPA